MSLRSFYALSVLTIFALGASCDKEEDSIRPDEQAASATGQGSEQAPQTEPVGGGEVIGSLPQVDISELTDAERERWVRLVNTELSPCGEPISVARCVAEEKSCRTCVPAARYLARLIAAGYDGGEISDNYRLRFSKETKQEIDNTGAPVRGNPMAPVTVTVFSDFECPYCGAAHPVLKRVMRELDGRVKLVYRHFPLSAHPHAVSAARAAVAAGKQGKFWEMHDLLFEHQDALESEDFDTYAKTLGLDVPRFRKDLESAEVQARVDRDKDSGRALEVEGTPTIFINGRLYTEPLNDLSVYLQEELAM